jgi:hypothetical protein
MASLGRLLGGLGGSTLGEVLVAVGLDTKQLKKGMAEAETNAKSAGSSFTKFGTIAAAGFAIAAVAATKFAVDAVHAYEEHQTALARLQTALNNNNTILDKSTAGFEAYAESLSRTTGFTETEITAAQAIAARFKLNATQTQALVQVSTDYARVSGKDLPSAALALGKALLGSGRAIKDMGQRFTDTGTLAGNYNEIIHLVGQSTKGAADAFSQTAAGAMAKFGAAWENLKVSFGGTAAGPIAATFNYLAQVLTYLPSVIGTFENAFIDMENVFIEGANAIGRAVNLFFPDMVTLGDHINEVDTSVNALIPDLNLTGTKFAFVGTKAEEVTKHFGKVKQNIADLKTSFDLQLTSLDSVKKGWDLTAAAAVRGSGIIAQKQKTIANDLHKLDELNIGQGLKDQMEALGPDMVRAFISGNHDQRQKILENLKAYNEALKATNTALKKQAHSGGQATGEALGEGLIAGIAAKTPAVAAAASAAVQAAIDAAKAKAGVASPSKVFRLLGHDIIEGLKLGLEEAAQDAVNVMTKLVDRFKQHFDDIKARFASFKQSISGGIAGFKDLASSIGGLFGQTDAAGNPIAVTGSAISANISGQVAQAQALASALQAGQAAGVNQNLLSQFAGQGAAGTASLNALLADPALVQQANAAYATITQAAQSTAKSLGEEFFGKSIRRARDRLDELSDALQILTRTLRMIQNGPDPTSDQLVAAAMYRQQRRRQSA